MSRILAIDLGTRRIGLALSDPTRSVAVPLRTLAHRERAQALAAIAALAGEHEVGRIVVGWPRNMDGTSGRAAKYAEAFAEALRRLVTVPVGLWDERLSTAAVTREMIAADLTRKRRGEIVDRSHSSCILQGCLDYLARTA